MTPSRTGECVSRDPLFACWPLTPLRPASAPENVLLSRRGTGAKESRLDRGGCVHQPCVKETSAGFLFCSPPGVREPPRRVRQPPGSRAGCPRGTSPQEEPPEGRSRAGRRAQDAWCHTQMPGRRAAPAPSGKLGHQGRLLLPLEDTRRDGLGISHCCLSGKKGNSSGRLETVSKCVHLGQGPRRGDPRGPRPPPGQHCPVTARI